METVAFGTQLDLNADDYEGLRHSIYPAKVHEVPHRVRIGGEKCTKPYVASLLNISAMSFGSLSANAVLALNAGAKKGGFYHNTGEGGLSEYHLRNGGDVVWQIEPGISVAAPRQVILIPNCSVLKAAHDQVRMIQIKLSQGKAKLGHMEGCCQR